MFLINVSFIKLIILFMLVVVQFGNRELPFTEKKGVDHPVSIYAATKRSNELMAHAYSHLYNLPATGLDFLLFMDLGVDQIWLYIDLQNVLIKIYQLIFIIMGI